MSLGPLTRPEERPSGSGERIDGNGVGEQVLKLNDVIPVTKYVSLENRQKCQLFTIIRVERFTHVSGCFDQCGETPQGVPQLVTAYLLYS